MSEPARTLLPPEAGSRTAPGPLRDWLTAMKSHRADAPGAAQPEAVRSDPEPAAAPRGGEAAWAPRLVPPVAPPQVLSDDADIAELMAENLMLKARLRLETDNQAALQATLADEIRALREHIRDEIGSLEDLRAEQEEIRAARAAIQAERERFQQAGEALRMERDLAVAACTSLRTDHLGLQAERDALRAERDLWRARTEALAQPLFQMQGR